VDLDQYRRPMSDEGLRPADLERAERMVPQRNADRFLACRSALYRVLGEALGREPEAVALRRGAFGKPELIDGAPHFNVSRSGAAALIGLCETMAIGVDIESIRAIGEADAIAREHFSSTELAKWERAGSETRDHRFLECWTRKEACLKALGTGLTLPPVQVDAGYAGALPRTLRLPLDGSGAEVTVCSVRLSTAAASVAIASEGAVRIALRAAARSSRASRRGPKVGSRARFVARSGHDGEQGGRWGNGPIDGHPPPRSGPMVRRAERSAACAAARRAMGTRNGEQLT
jgi:4'-phosphopantetheinyl transferase